MKNKEKIKKIREIRKQLYEIKRKKLSEGLFDQIMANITSKKAEGWIEDLYDKDPELAKRAEKLRQQALDLKQSMDRTGSAIDKL